MSLHTADAAHTQQRAAIRCGCIVLVVDSRVLTPQKDVVKNAVDDDLLRDTRQFDSAKYATASAGVPLKVPLVRRNNAIVAGVQVCGEERCR